MYLKHFGVLLERVLIEISKISFIGIGVQGVTV